MNPSNRPSTLSTRRFFLRATGVSLALPLLESLGARVFAQNSAVGTLPGKVAGAERPMRMVCIGNMLGFHPPAFFPENTGPGYALPPDIESLKPHQKDLTLFSGLDHGVKGGHFAISATREERRERAPLLADELMQQIGLAVFQQLCHLFRFDVALQDDLAGAEVAGAWLRGGFFAQVGHAVGVNIAAAFGARAE